MILWSLGFFYLKGNSVFNLLLNILAICIPGERWMCFLKQNDGDFMKLLSVHVMLCYVMLCCVVSAHFIGKIKISVKQHSTNLTFISIISLIDNQFKLNWVIQLIQTIRLWKLKMYKKCLFHFIHCTWITMKKFQTFNVV